MSQLQVTGEAKIRDIQGPVVANSGVVTALDGAASQYVRGDGTLADFPTSSGGGSSVSYYLNSSVSQGTIGGVAYRELSKDPIIGAGTDIAISTTGYVASYITDVNDPDVTLVPGGNFNCEFYFSVNNNSGNPFTYAELYKYDGTTFTLLGSSVGVPEYINQGTIIAPYYFAIPVATAALALTDRLAIRIYVNVDGRTVTLHTENGHLCQVVTTLSKGMVSLNNLTDQSQFITTGTAGTNFAIVSSGDTHTFNLPVASATNTGKLSSTDWSTFNGKVPYTGATANVDLGSFSLTASTVGAAGFFGLGSGTVSGYIALKQGTTFFGNVTGYNSINAISTKYLLISDIGSTNYKSASFELGLLTNNTERTFTLPDLSGTLALLEGTQTFTGTKRFDTGVLIKNGVSPSSSGYTGIGAGTSGITVNLGSGGGGYLVFQSTAYDYTFPASSGTIALTSNLSSYLPLSGGTLTGALTGTSATFSSSANSVINIDTFPTSAGEAGLRITDSTRLTILARTGSAYTYRGVPANSGFLYSNTKIAFLADNPGGGFTFHTGDSSQILSLASTGAATFSSSVTANSLIVDGNPLSASFNSSTGVYTRYKYNGTNVGIIGTANQIIGGGSTTAFAIGTESNDYMLFLTNNAERLRITSGGNVGIGTSSPSSFFEMSKSSNSGSGGTFPRLAIKNTLATQGDGSSTFNFADILISSGNESVNMFLATTYAAGTWAPAGIINVSTNHDLQIKTNNTTRLTISNTGAATFSSSVTATRLNGINSAGGIVSQLGSTNTSNTYIDYLYNNSSIAYIGNGPSIFAGAGVTDLGITTSGASALMFGTTNTERMRITSGGALLVGTTANDFGSRQVNFSSTSYTYHSVRNGTASEGHLVFSNANGAVGSIFTSGSSTSYNTSSDYRLKQDLKDFNGLDLVSAIKTYDYEWKSDNTRMYGMVAHELQEIIPYAVQGEKDAEQMQAVDYSKLVPILVKAIQELSSEITELKALIAAK